MNSEIKTYSYPNGEIQRVQVVRWEDWSQLEFLYPKYNDGALECFRDIYQNYLVPACPWIFPQMVMFQLPEDLDVRSFWDGMLGENNSDKKNGFIFYETEEYGVVNDPLTIASIILQNGVKLKGGKPVFSNKKAEQLYKELDFRDCVHIVCGKLPVTKVIPVGKCAGYLSEVSKDAQLKVNANFFIMDPIDCATIYDQVGTPFGLCVKNGVVLHPPLFGRETLLVKKDGSVSIRQMDVRQLEIEINGVQYVHGKNATIYTRPANAKTPGGKGVRLVIVGRKVVAVKNGGRVQIPASGFVICVDESCVSVTEDKKRTEYRGMSYGKDMETIPGEIVLCEGESVDFTNDFVRTGDFMVTAGDEVIYHGLEDVQFGIQVGNSIIRDGVKTERFVSRFYNIYHLEKVPFPPSLYPMNFEKARAARIALGADKSGKPMLFWAEGAGKLNYTLGQDSTGASLTEMAEIAEDLGMVNAVNLDGGGSAQILMRNKRALLISDRNKGDNSEAERLVPLGLVVR